jgi:hypothetical protein
MNEQTNLDELQVQDVLRHDSYWAEQDERMAEFEEDAE